MAELLVPGRPWQRLCFALLVPIFGWASYAWWHGDLHGGITLLLGFATFVTGVLSSAPVFRAWVAFGERLNRVIISLIFGLIYFAVVPLFLFARRRDRLGLRGAAQKSSFWIARPAVEESVERMARMG